MSTAPSPSSGSAGWPTSTRATFATVDPDRILLAHGRGVVEDATGALDDPLENARLRLPYALLTTAPGEVRAMVDAVR